MTTETAAKRDTQKLQRAIVDGLEDVKAQDIQVFDTEHLSSLFERVIVASGTSNRQTKALAASVRDAVREAGFPKPRIEGEANGEWIIVDCSQAVVHIMQPTFRAYYHLEELWGEKPVRLKFGASKPAVKVVDGQGAGRQDAPGARRLPARTPARRSAGGKPAAAAKTAVAAGSRKPAPATAKPAARAAAKAPAKAAPPSAWLPGRPPPRRPPRQPRSPQPGKPAARKA